MFRMLFLNQCDGLSLVACLNDVPDPLPAVLLDWGRVDRSLQAD
jgi:hypothetical protein